LKKYAIRVFCNKHHTYVQPNVDVVQPRKTEGGEEENQEILSEVTLGDVMVETFPRLFERVINDNGDIEYQKLRPLELVV
jgi:hypothetical protein